MAVGVRQIYGFILFTGCVNIALCQNTDFIRPEGNSVAEATKLFSAKLYHATKNSIPGGNFVISPFSVASLLSMLREGANGFTREELSEVMRFEGLSDNTISSGYSDILYSLHENKATFVKISNRIYLSNSANIQQDFTDVLQKKYLTQVLPANFFQGQEVADDINNWVEKSTEGKITNLSTADAITPDTKAIIANAIYFNGKWVKDFNEKATREHIFLSDDGNTTKAMFMEQEDVFPHVELPELLSSAISMPYMGDRFSLVVILPNKGVTLDEVENKLQRSTPLTEIPSKMSKKSIQLLFPKFRLETEVDFTKTGILKKLGLNDAVTPGKADFSLISKDSRIHIDTMIQKCFIDITEYGTEAAGVTYIKIVPFSIRRSTPFKVTKPFFAYIFDSVTKTILFTVRKSSV